MGERSHGAFPNDLEVYKYHSSSLVCLDAFEGDCRVITRALLVFASGHASSQRVNRGTTAVYHPNGQARHQNRKKLTLRIQETQSHATWPTYSTCSKQALASWHHYATVWQCQSEHDTPPPLGRQHHTQMFLRGICPPKKSAVCRTIYHRTETLVHTGTW